MLGNLESSACCLNLRLPPGGNLSFPGKFTGPISQNFLTLLPEATVLHPCWTSLWLLALVCSLPGIGDRSPAQVSRSSPETRTHLVIFTASGGGVGMAMCSLRKIITKVVFELTAEGRVGCQMCACFSSGSVCVPEDTGQQVRLGSEATRGKVARALCLGGRCGAERGTAIHRWPAPPLVSPVSCPSPQGVGDAEGITCETLSSMSG